MMRWSKPCQPYHNVGPFMLWIFWRWTAAEFLFTYCSSLGSESWRWSHRPNEINVGVSQFRSLKSETLARRLCALIELTCCFAVRLKTTTDLAHDRRLLLRQKHVMVKSNQIYFSVAENNNTQYKSIDLKYDIALLKEWMVRQADTNTIPIIRVK